MSENKLVFAWDSGGTAVDCKGEPWNVLGDRKVLCLDCSGDYTAIYVLQNS